MATGDFNNFSRGALVVAHPSHELRVHGWLQMACPRVFVLTDGSGREGHARLPSTTKVLNDVGSSLGSIYGRFTDLEIYSALLKGDFDVFIRLTEELADEFSKHEIEYVVADSAEGYNTSHDVCRLVTDAAVATLTRRNRRSIANYEFLVVGPPDECPATSSDEAIWVNLDDEAFLRKVDAARGYNSKLAFDVEAALSGQPFQGVRRFSEPQLAGNVDKAVSAEVELALRSRPELLTKMKDLLDGVELNRFRVECLRPIHASLSKSKAAFEIPFYELYGERLVKAGHYETAIRYADHFRPVAEAVWQHVETLNT